MRNAVIVMPLLHRLTIDYFAQQRLGSRFTGTAIRAYNACLFAAWIEDYCRGNLLETDREP